MTTQCCRTCAYARWLSPTREPVDADTYGHCEYPMPDPPLPLPPVPDAVSLNWRHRMLAPADGTTCPCWAERTGPPVAR